MHASSAFDGREVCRIQRIYQLHTARATQRNGRPQSVFCSLCSVANQPTKPCPRRFRLCGVSFPRYLSLVARRWPHPRRLRGILARLSPSAQQEGRRSGSITAHAQAGCESRSCDPALGRPCNGMVREGRSRQSLAAALSLWELGRLGAGHGK